MTRRDKPKDAEPESSIPLPLESELRRHYSEKAVDHMLRPRNIGPIPRPDGYVKVQSEHGESLEFFLLLDGESVAHCAFRTDGCAATLAAASAATELAAGRSLSGAMAATAADRILEALGGLPEGNVHCAAFVAEGFRKAVADALEQRNASWKKLYRKIT